jgi:hypothetical protein
MADKLTAAERDLVLDALAISSAFKVYGEGREAHQAAIRLISDKLQRKAEPAPEPAPAVTVNAEQGLYVIPAGGGGFTCLGFDVLIERYDRLATELQGHNRGRFPLEERGTLAGYARYQALHDQARATGRRFLCELSPQLIGLEGHRVEVSAHGETRRFIVGKSTGWIPIHLEIARRDSSGGGGASRTYDSVRDLGKVRG